MCVRTFRVFIYKKLKKYKIQKHVQLELNLLTTAQ